MTAPNYLGSSHEKNRLHPKNLGAVNKNNDIIQCIWEMSLRKKRFSFKFGRSDKKTAYSSQILSEITQMRAGYRQGSGA